jgi:DNA-binding NarL/FixJ family response regulator
MSIRVLIADDQSLVRAGFRLVLENQPDLEVVGEAANGNQAVHGVGRLKPDVVLMDIRMPELDGIAATRQITARHRARVLVLATYDLDEYVTTRCRREPAAFCSRTRRRRSSPTASAPSRTARRCSRRPSPAA